MMIRPMGIRINRDVIMVEAISVYLIETCLYKHAPSLPPLLAAIFTLKSAAQKASVTIMSCLFVSKHINIYSCRPGVG